jgi:hypothetical protein
MPIHDWTRVESGTFHDFHQDWTIEIRRTLNAGILPPGYFAMADQRVSGPEPDVVALQLRSPSNQPTSGGNGATAVADSLPRLRQSHRLETSIYARKANRIAIRHRHGRVVAIIEVISPGNKESAHALRSFVAKAVELLRNGIHLLIVDLFPPTRRDPVGIHQVIWQELTDVPFEPRPPDKPLTVAAYDADEALTAYVEPLAVGDALPDAPLFLEPGWYVDVPLEATYQRSWEMLPRVIRDLVETPPAGSA